MDLATIDDLERRIAAVVGQLNALHGQLVELVAEALATEAWAGDGLRSPQHWLSWQAGLSSAHARELVRLATARATHPKITEAFAEGELTVDQAAVAVMVQPHHDAEVADLARKCTVHQLRNVVRCSQPMVAPARPAEAPSERLSTWHDADGRLHGELELDADHGAIVAASLEAARDRLFHGGRPAVTWVDAMIDVCQRSLDAEDPPRRERFRVNLFLDPGRPIPATWGDGTPVPDAIRRHLTCDGTLVPTFVEDGRPVSVGRTQRVVPDRTRRLVLHRDRACRVPWCGRTRWLQVHHIVHWEDGGRTDTDNLIALCPGCHRRHHRGELGLTGNADEPDGVVVTDRFGRAHSGAPRRAPPVPPPPVRTPYRHPLGERFMYRGFFLNEPRPPPDVPDPA